MRIFNTLQELWAYCLFCPICQEPSRTISLTIGPDDQFRLDQNYPYQKTSSQLELISSTKLVRTANFVIDCQSNQVAIKTNISNLCVEYFYFYIYADCQKCLRSHINSADLEYDSNSQKISNLQIERENFLLPNDKGEYHLVYLHDLNEIRVARIPEDKRYSSEAPEGVRLPQIQFDFTNIPKLVNKIKTLILFS